MTWNWNWNLYPLHQGMTAVATAGPLDFAASVVLGSDFFSLLDFQHFRQEALLGSWAHGIVRHSTPGFWHV